MSCNITLDERFIWYYKLAEITPDSILFCDMKGNIIDANNAAINSYGYTYDELCSLNIYDIRVDRENIKKQMYQINLKGNVFEAIHRRKDGSVFNVEVTSRLISLGDKKIIGSIIRDISELTKTKEKLNYLNYHDVLTGMYNRRYFDKKLKDLDSKEQLPISVMKCDIDGLKSINDSLGHAMGDEIIISVSKVLTSMVPKAAVVARTGGDDFSIIMPKTDMGQSNNLMKKLRVACNDALRNRTSVSIGFATKNYEDDSLESIARSAEDFMYRNKLLQNKSLHNSVIASMKTTLFEKSQETEAHAERLIKYSKEIDKRMKLTDSQLSELELLSVLHDIGKIGISDSIINKPGRLTKEERLTMNKHPLIGYRIAKTTNELRPIAEYILYHHERYDGKGYPEGLSGKDIPLLSRIVSVVDAYDAMTEDRPYRSKMNKDMAIQEIRDNAGTQFDPDIAELFISIITEENQGFKN